MTTATPADKLQQLPEPIGHLHSDGDFCQDKMVPTPCWWPVAMFTADQLTAHASALLSRAELAEQRIQQLEDLIDKTVDSLLVLGLQPSIPSSAVSALLEEIASIDAALAKGQQGVKG